MNKKSPDITINLVPKDPFFTTALGRGMQWALSAGRYIVIFTEIVVILSFAARFTLDRKVSDLNKQLLNSQSVITSYGELERNFRLAQAQIEEYSAINQETNLTEVFANITTVTPPDVVIDELVISPSTVFIKGSTYSQSSFNVLINNLQISPDFLNVSVGTVEAKDSNSTGLLFTISADTTVVKRVAPAAVQEEKVELLDRTQGL
jgi:hypothetical protein